MTLDQQNLEVTELKMMIDAPPAELEQLHTNTVKPSGSGRVDLMHTGTLKGLGQLTKKGLALGSDSNHQQSVINENDLIGESESEIESARLGVLNNLKQQSVKAQEHMRNNNKQLDDILDSGHFYQTESERDEGDLAGDDARTPSGLGSLSKVKVGLDLGGDSARDHAGAFVT